MRHDVQGLVFRGRGMDMRDSSGGAKNPWEGNSRWAATADRPVATRPSSEGDSSESAFSGASHKTTDGISRDGSFAAVEMLDNGEMAPVMPPKQYLYLGLLSVLVGALVGLLGTSLWMSITGWVLAGVIAMGLASVFTVIDARLQAEIFYSVQSSTRILYRALIVSSLIGVVVTAVRIALFVGRA